MILGSIGLKCLGSKGKGAESALIQAVKTDFEKNKNGLKTQLRRLNIAGDVDQVVYNAFAKASAATERRREPFTLTVAILGLVGACVGAGGTVAGAGAEAGWWGRRRGPSMASMPEKVF